MGLEEKLAKLRRLRNQKKDLEEAIDKVQAECVDELGEDAWLVTDPDTGEKLAASVRRDQILVVDELMLEVEAPEVFKATTVAKVDRERFERAVLGGMVPGEILAKVAAYKDKKPFIQFTKPTDRA